MAHHRLGHEEQARKGLAALREARRLDPFWDRDEEARAFLSEADAEVQGPPSGPPE
jgi:hypothetical protein